MKRNSGNTDGAPTRQRSPTKTTSGILTRPAAPTSLQTQRCSCGIMPRRCWTRWMRQLRSQRKCRHHCPTHRRRLRSRTLRLQCRHLPRRSRRRGLGQERRAVMSRLTCQARMLNPSLRRRRQNLRRKTGRPPVPARRQQTRRRRRVRLGTGHARWGQANQTCSDS